MCRITGGVLVLLLALPAAADQVKPKEKPKEKPAVQSPAHQYQALTQEYQKAMQGWQKAYREAKTDEQRKKVFADYQKADSFAPKMLALAEKHPKDPAAIDALIWAATRGMVNSPGSAKAKAFAILRRDYIKSKKIGPLCDALTYQLTPENEKFLKEVMEKNPDRTIQATACVALAEGLKNGGRAKESEKLLATAAKKYADVGLPLKGLKAPDITGIDQDGKKFRLSDYAGKVVLLDFWGNW
jgi:hypothetical protein